jgi:hypothetical protein
LTTTSPAGYYVYDSLTLWIQLNSGGQPIDGGSNPCVTPTLTPTPSVTPTLTPTPSVTPTLTPTPTVTPSPTPTCDTYWEFYGGTTGTGGHTTFSYTDCNGILQNIVVGNGTTEQYCGYLTPAPQVTNDGNGTFTNLGGCP